jgi:hypothetical protein
MNACSAALPLPGTRELQSNNNSKRMIVNRPRLWRRLGFAAAKSLHRALPAVLPSQIENTVDLTADADNLSGA